MIKRTKGGFRGEGPLPYSSQKTTSMRGETNLSQILGERKTHKKNGQHSGGGQKGAVNKRIYTWEVKSRRRFPLLIVV